MDGDVFRRIQHDFDEMSKLSVEVAIYIHYILNKEWESGIFDKKKDFLQYFYALSTTGKQSRKTDTMDIEYRNLRQGHIKELANRSYLSNPIVFASKQYLTLYNNNIWMHGYNRIKRFLKLFDNNKTRVFETLDYLFNSNNRFQADPTLIARMIEYLDYDGNRILKIKEDPQQHIRLFYNLKGFNHMYLQRNFSLVPIYKHGLHHIRYDSQAMFTCLSGLKKTGDVKREQFNVEEWKKYFKLPETVNRKFHGSISTDGVAVTFAMERLVPKRTQRCDEPATEDHYIEHTYNDESYLETIKGNLIKQSFPNEMLHYDVYIGLDPGLKLTFGGSWRSTLDEFDEKNTIKLKSGKFRAMSGAVTRKYTLDKITREIEKESKSQISPNQDFYIEYTRHRLKWFVKKQNVYSQRKVARLKLKKFICVEAAAHAVSKSLVQNRKALVFVGASKISSNSPMRGYIRSPQRALLKALRTHADVVEVNEYRTTQLCSQTNCHQFVKTSRSPKRYQFCQKCGTKWNRDVNAGNNMIYVGSKMLLGGEVHEHFLRR